MPANIHPTAIVSPKAQLGREVSVGPYAIIEDDVVIGEGTSIGAQTSILRWTELGRNNQVSPQVVLGGPPQDSSYSGEETHLVIGDNNLIREFVTMTRGTLKGGGITRLGSNCMLMNYCHIGHDCQVADDIVMANSVSLGGHVEVGRGVVFGGLVGVLQFCRIGDFAFIGGLTGVTKDSPPFIIAEDRRQRLRGLNLVGLRRSGFDRHRIGALKQAYKALFISKEGIFKKRLAALMDSEIAAQPDVAHLIEFITTSKMGIAH